MLEISKFKLIDGGRGGISIEAREAVQLSKNYQVIDKITRERKLILPDEIIYQVQLLKYHFLNCTGHWMPPFNNYYDLLGHKLTPIEVDPKTNKMKAGQQMLNSLWNKTDITGVSFKSGGFVITGTVEAVDGKKTVMNTPFITEEDDLGFFTDAIDRIGDCIHSIVNNFNVHELPSYNPATVLSEEEMKGLDMSELTSLVVEKLVDRNMIMLVRDDGDNPAIEENTKKDNKVNTNTGSIDSHNMPDKTISEDDVSEADEQVRKNLLANQKDVFGRPASDNEFPEELRSKDKVAASDLAELEHSTNMGLGGEEVNKEAEKWEE